ncbi:hypothetical protein V6N13_072930 [Hibiscus sabdariffa]|uniref:Uncharacterized protein n=1 Tax=Hibiscus sabdariffa TaxID=183260 RepID=A0ABR2EB63_9ROSI
MPRPLLLVFLVLVIVFTSQFEWKQQFGEEIEPTPTVSLKDLYVSNRQDSVKEKIILSQERNIQKLNEQVRNLQDQLLHCKVENEVTNRSGSAFALTEYLTELEQQPMLDD